MALMRILIISDTHGEDLDYSQLPQVDVAIHCGDLTEESKLAEFEATINVLRTVRATVKLVIAGNHDFTLDEPVFRQKIATAPIPLDPHLVRATYGDFGDAERLLKSEPDIKLLDEGTHDIELRDGVRIKVFASPYTASKSDWGFTYDPADDHSWDIEPGTDIVITHSPPKGILDLVNSRRVGSGSLFAAVASARPRLHCFGHIHEGWGAKLAGWRDIPKDLTPCHFTAIDNGKSKVAETLAGLTAGKFDSREVAQEKDAKLQELRRQGYCSVMGSAAAPGEETLFVNASIESVAGGQPQLPWIVELDCES